MALAHDASALLGRVLRSVHAGSGKLAGRVVGSAATQTLAVWSPAFPDAGPLPLSATVEGEGAAPELCWSDVPSGTLSLAVLCEDPDAPLPRPFVHWLVWGIPSTTSGLDPWDLDDKHEGKNSSLRRGFAAAAPPLGHGRHHYHFQVFALDVPLDLDDDAGRSALLQAMRGHVLAWGDTVGVYERA